MVSAILTILVTIWIIRILYDNFFLEIINYMLRLFRKEPLPRIKQSKKDHTHNHGDH